MRTGLGPDAGSPLSNHPDVDKVSLLLYFVIQSLHLLEVSQLEVKS